MLIQILKSEIHLPKKITVTHTEYNISALNIINTETGTCLTIIQFQNCDMIINVLFLYNNSLLTLLHRCTTIVTEQSLI